MIDIYALSEGRGRSRCEVARGQEHLGLAWLDWPGTLGGTVEWAKLTGEEIAHLFHTLRAHMRAGRVTMGDEKRDEKAAAAAVAEVSAARLARFDRALKELKHRAHRYHALSKADPPKATDLAVVDLIVAAVRATHALDAPRTPPDADDACACAYCAGAPS